MERSTIYYLKQKGWTNTQIAKMVGCHRDTVRKVLNKPVDQEPMPRNRQSGIAVFETQINRWLEGHLSVRRMLELARSDEEHPYQGGDAAFYNYVQPLRQARMMQVAEVAARVAGFSETRPRWAQCRQLGALCDGRYFVESP